MPFEGKIRKISASHYKSPCYLLEVELDKGRLSPHRLKFILSSELIKAIPKETLLEFLNNMTYRHIKKGERFIKQGEKGTRFYLILNGSCSVNLEKNNMLHNVSSLGVGDIVGEMAVFTGERRSAHVDAETEMDLLSMDREQFETLSMKYPELKNFITEVITHRLSTSRLIADRTVGKYVINEIIDAGGSGILYKGIHRKLNTPVAIKMLKHNMADPDFIDIFRNEAKIIAKLNHPNIVKVYDIDELYQTVFIIMEYLDGVSLKNILNNRKKLSLSSVLDITIQICLGLEYAHKHGIIHQDINPRNIFIRSDGQVKIIDFGLACPPGHVDCNFLFPGTAPYITPEQIKGDSVDERSDIYSLGMTVYEMIAGQKPITNNIKELVKLHHHHDIARKIYSKILELPDELHNFFIRTIQRSPSARYQNVSEILDELFPLAERLGIKVQPQFFKQDKIMNMFLIYQDEHQLALNRFIEEFNKNVSEIGAVLKVTQIEKI